MSREWWEQPGNRSDIGDNTRVIRPALHMPAKVIEIRSATYTDRTNASADLSGSAQLYAEASDSNSSYGGEKVIYYDFEQSITFGGDATYARPIILGCARLVQWYRDGADNSNIQMRVRLTPVTSWGGLTMATLNWNNQGTPTYGTANVGAAYTASKNIPDAAEVDGAFQNGDNSSLGYEIGFGYRIAGTATAVGVRIEVDHTSAGSGAGLSQIRMMNQFWFNDSVRALLITTG